MALEKDLWNLSVGDKHLASGKNRSASFMYSKMDSLVAGGDGQPLVIDTEDEKVLIKAAEYAAQKGYDLVSPDPEQNLKIMAKQNAMAGEEIAEGQLEPSKLLQKTEEQASIRSMALPAKQKALDQLAKDKQALDAFDEAIPYSDDPSQRAKEHAESTKKHAEIQAREKDYQERGWLPTPEKVAEPAVDDPAADIAKIAAQMKVAAEVPLSEQVQPVAGVQPPAGVPDFPEKRPAEVLAHRWKVATAKDHGNRIVITRMGMLAVTPPQKRERQELVTAALLKSRERFGDPVRVTGNKAFENEVIKAAIAQGIPLEMGSDRGEKAYDLALKNEKKRGLEKAVGQLTPSKERDKALPGATPPAKGFGLQR
jgi:hypothetical protein